MIAGLGTDIVEIHRIREIYHKLGDVFVSRILTPTERDYCMLLKDPAIRIAGRYAAKEAVMKALGTGLRGMRWHDVEIIRDSAGKPSVCLHGGAQRLAEEKNIVQILLSISHSREYAVAQAIAWQKEGDTVAHCS